MSYLKKTNRTSVLPKVVNLKKKFITLRKYLLQFRKPQAYRLNNNVLLIL